MDHRRVLIVNKTFRQVGVQLLESNKLQPVVIPYVDYEPEMIEEVKKNLPGVHAVIWNTKHRLTEPLLELAGPQLKAVSTTSSGLDHIDIEPLTKRGIALGHSPQVVDNAVAEIAIGLMVAAARKFKESVDEIVSGGWKFGIQWNVGQEVAGSTVGIVGLGGIGQAIVKKLKGFDVDKFIYSGRTDKPEAKTLGIERVSFEKLLQESDFVILACPLVPETKHLINANTLKMMKKKAVLINIARGGLIDQEALYVALKEKQIFAAGLDVVTPEPIPKDHPLISLPNCYILPHTGTATIETRDAMAKIAAQNIILALQGQPMLFPAN